MLGLSPGSLSEDGETSCSRRASTQATTSSADPTKSCRVCGDKSNGYNFGVLTCESCKAFFRRNASRHSSIKCPFSGECQITAASRRFCQACRLSKCFSEGMNKDWLGDGKSQRAGTKRRTKNEPGSAENSDEEVTVSKAYLNDLIRKSQRKLDACECVCECGFYPQGTRLTAIAEPSRAQQPVAVDVSSMVKSPFSPHSPFPRQPTPSSQTTNDPRISKSECNSAFSPLPASLPQMLPMSSFSPLNTNLVPSYSLRPLNQNDPMFTALANFPSRLPPMAFAAPLPNAMSPKWNPPPVMAAASFAMSSAEVADPQRKVTVSEYSQLIKHGRDTTRTRYSTLPSDEFALLQELMKANEVLNAPLEWSCTDDMSLMDIVRITELALRRIVLMSKDLKAFNQLNIEDRKILIKGGCCELLILRGVMAFDPTRNVWNHGLAQGVKEMEVKLEILKSTSEATYYDEHKKFLESFADSIRKSEGIMLVLMAIVLFRPERGGLDEVEKIRATQQQYYSLLQKVLECELDPREVRTTHDLLLHNIGELKLMNDGLVRIYYGFDPSQLAPLLKELFDMM